MQKYYTDERNVQILISLMKQHGIKNVVASPGTTNLTFVASIQQDPFFKIYSSVDERSAAYLACGIAAESGEPVAITCTGATASRNYASGLTEAYYRKLPVLAITASQPLWRIGQNIPQVIDRTTQLNDIAKLSIQLMPVKTTEDALADNIQVNKALLELTHRGSGPVHINLITTYSRNYSVKKLPKERVIDRVSYSDELPALTSARVGIFVGAHLKWSKRLTDSVDKFCQLYNGAVFRDHTSNYQGKYGIDADLVCSQSLYDTDLKNFDVLIHIGDVSGSDIKMNPRQIWRVNPDGEVRDTFGKLKFVFEMDEEGFFQSYVELNDGARTNLEFYKAWLSETKRLWSKVPSLPFSNAWIAQQTLPLLPENSVLHLGILNSLRSWNFFKAPQSVLSYANTGGFGIDGDVSALMGASFTNHEKLFFGVFGDLAFFYDLNVNGNRHVGRNVRILMINNGVGTEFKNYNHFAAQFGDEADAYIAARGHFGNKSKQLVKDFSKDLGFEYLSASNKDEFLKNVRRFTAKEQQEKPIIFEVFTSSDLESKALELMKTIESTPKGKTKSVLKRILGEKGVSKVKEIMGR